MRHLLSRVRQFVIEEDGPTATEYAVMLALVIVVALTAVKLCGLQVNQIYQSSLEDLGAAQEAADVGGGSAPP